MHAHPTLAHATLGCRTNQAETAQLVMGLADVCAVVRFSEPADVYVINTCTVTHEADRQSRQLVRRAHRSNPAARIVVTGCAAEHHFSEFATMPGVAWVARNAEKEAIGQAIAGWYEAREAPWSPVPPDQADHTRIWLKISEGCDQRCSYCIVPQVRGPEQSLEAEVLVGRAHQLAELGYQEIVLSGTHLGAYGRGTGSGLADLLGRLIAEVPTIPRWRIGSLEPLDFPDPLIEQLRDPRICPQLHLCLQSGSTRILNAMRRRYRSDQYLQLVERLRAARPELAFTTDVIVGFPGETEEDFQQTLDVIAEVGFAGVHLFPFSAREGTHAATLPDRPSAATMGARMARAHEVAHRCQRRWQEGFLGREVEVLTEKASGEQRSGISREGLRVGIATTDTRANQRWLVQVKALEGDQVIVELLRQA